MDFDYAQQNKRSSVSTASMTGALLSPVRNRTFKKGKIRKLVPEKIATINIWHKVDFTHEKKLGSLESMFT